VAGIHAASVVTATPDDPTFSSFCIVRFQLQHTHCFQIPINTKTPIASLLHGALTIPCAAYVRHPWTFKVNWREPAQGLVCPVSTLLREFIPITTSTCLHPPRTARSPFQLLPILHLLNPLGVLPISNPRKPDRARPQTLQVFKHDYVEHHNRS
jgi:hypothetical protein